MDPEANLREQLFLSNEAMKIWDNCNDDGTFSDDGMVRLAAIAYRLSELVLALNEWNRKCTPVSAGL